MSETFLHIDRTNSLEPGDELELDWSFQLGGGETPKTEPHNQELLQEMYPEGLSRHGFRYASAILTEDNNVSTPGQSKPLVMALPTLDSDQSHIFSEPTSARIEWFFELVRLAEFESCPSRFQSFFAWRNKSEIDGLKPVRDRDAQLVKLKGDCYEQRDMSLLKLSSFTDGLKNARMYWKGNESPNPVREILIQPPVNVVEVNVDE